MILWHQVNKFIRCWNLHTKASGWLQMEQALSGIFLKLQEHSWWLGQQGRGWSLPRRHRGIIFVKFCENTDARDWSTIAIFRVELKQFKKKLAFKERDRGRYRPGCMATAINIFCNFGIRVFWRVGNRQYFWQTWSSSTPQCTSIIKNPLSKEPRRWAITNQQISSHEVSYLSVFSSCHKASFSLRLKDANHNRLQVSGLRLLNMNANHQLYVRDL
jgi:hypothetical protein